MPDVSGRARLAALTVLGVSDTATGEQVSAAYFSREQSLAAGPVVMTPLSNKPQIGSRRTHEHRLRP